ncbi:Major facilitator superfamily domain-containing protein 12 [Linum perenne]
MGDNEIGDDEDLSRAKSDGGRRPVFYYGVGHMLNDITSSCWFTYLLLFLADIGLSPKDAAIVMLSGQVADGFATVFVGELIDRFGHFKIWHGAGSVLVAVSFSSVFGGCLPCRLFSTGSSVVETISYSTFAAIFNIGWAATQVSHILYAIAFAVFNIIRGKSHADIENQYRWIAYSSIFIGCCFVGIFHLGTKEPRLKMNIHEDGHTRIAWAYWFKKVLYYQVGIVYVLTRLIQNVSQAYLAFYVIQDLHLGQSAKALVPAIIYISSFVVSIMMQEVSWTGRLLKAYFSVGGILWVLCGATIILLPCRMGVLMYIISAFIGIANALMMVTAVSMQNVLVGTDFNGSAFVCGSLSFLDKMSCGIALYVLQSYQSEASPVAQAPDSLSSGYVSVTRYGLGLLPAVCSLVGVGVTCTMKLHTHSESLTVPLLE